jgi:hypothetical protein
MEMFVWEKSRFTGKRRRFVLTSLVVRASLDRGPFADPRWSDALGR